VPQTPEPAPAPQPAQAPPQAPQAPQSAQPPQAVPAATFQPPLVIFQPPEIDEARVPASGTRQRGAAGGPGDDDDAGRGGTGRGGQGRAADGSAAADQEGEGPAGGTAGRRRRRGGRGAKGRGAGEAGAEGGAAADGQDGDAAGHGGAGQGSGGRAKAAGAQRVAAGSASSDGDGAADGATPGDGSTADSGGRGDAGQTDERGAGDGGAGGDGPATPARRRRRRQRGGSAGESEAAATDDPPDTVVHVRAARAVSDAGDVKSVKGSTRLEAKRQRRREGRDSGRRRPPIITESEFLARREAVERVMVVRQHGERTQIAVLEDGILVEHYVDKASHQSYVGNVYLGKVQNVLPSMEAAFVDIGKGRNAVLYAGEVNFDASGLEGVAKRIESALKSGQSILVQVTKDPIGHKGARLTSQVSLPGRYLVYVPGASMTGISRKLPDTERARLKQILKQVMPENAGVIVRTAAEGASEEELSHDVARLSAQWEAIERKAKTASAPELLYSEPDLTLRVVRDIFNEDFGKLVIASDSDWDMVDEYVRYVAPHLADRMERWTGDGDVFAAYRLDEQLAKALDRKVWLPSGGSLVIDGTEAMTVIDVNTGKFTGQGGNLEQTVTKNNLEAAEEIVRQLRLRDVGGMIVIDFIDMVLESNRDLVLRRLIECLARDRTKHQVAEVTSLGLVQMTRKRVGSGLLEAFSVPCEHCNGRGVIVSLELVDHVPPRGRAGEDRPGSGERKPKEGRSPRGGRRGGGAGGAAAEAKPAEARPAILNGGREHVTGESGAAGASSAAGGQAHSAAASGDLQGAEPVDGPRPAGAARTRSGRTRATRPAGRPAAEADEPAVADGQLAAGQLTAGQLAAGQRASDQATGGLVAGAQAAQQDVTGGLVAGAQAAQQDVTGGLVAGAQAAQQDVTGGPMAGGQTAADEDAAGGQPVGDAAAGARSASTGRRRRGRAGQKDQPPGSSGDGTGPADQADPGRQHDAPAAQPAAS
jgi:ribonuclease E